MEKMDKLITMLGKIAGVANGPPNRTMLGIPPQPRPPNISPQAPYNMPVITPNVPQEMPAPALQPNGDVLRKQRHIAELLRSQGGPDQAMPVA